MSVNIPKLNSSNPSWSNYLYRYDQLNRLSWRKQYTSTSTAAYNASYTAAHTEGYHYDGNGNILDYYRYNQAGTQTEALGYEYNTGTNQLNYVHGTSAALGGQSAGNYQYDGTGNLIKDVKTGITNINWTVYGKIQNIRKSASDSITYSYDPAGERQSKRRDSSGTSTTTYYVRDAQGNTLAVYDNKASHINWREQDLYGAKRLGVFLPNLRLGTDSIQAAWDTMGHKRYELTNHLGNVMATITDRRLQAGASGDTVVTKFDAEVVNAQDYNSFGSIMEGRQLSTADSALYRYGFNGKENDNDVGKGPGGEQDYGARIYDPRLGRFLSVDPIAESYPWYTPYQFAGDNPVSAVDVDGEEPLYFMIRRYERSSYFGTPFISKGDARSTSIDTRATARVHHLIGVEISKSNDGNPIIYNNAISSSSKQYTPWPGKGKESPSFEATGQINNAGDGISTIYFGFKDSGAEPIAKKLFGSIMPAIDTKGFVAMTVNQNNNTVTIHGSVSGDDFPDGEAFIYDAAGNGFNIGEFKHSALSSPVINLLGEGDSELMNFDINVKLDKNGNFKNGSIMKDGKSINLKLYNKKDTHFSPNGLHKDKSSSNNENF